MWGEEGQASLGNDCGRGACVIDALSLFLRTSVKGNTRVMEQSRNGWQDSDVSAQYEIT